MTYKPRNSNIKDDYQGRSWGQWFMDRRHDQPSAPCGFEPERWVNRKGAN